jgi:hypothetical protein
MFCVLASRSIYEISSIPHLYHKKKSFKICLWFSDWSPHVLKNIALSNIQSHGNAIRKAATFTCKF